MIAVGGGIMLRSRKRILLVCLTGLATLIVAAVCFLYFSTPNEKTVAPPAIPNINVAPVAANVIETNITYVKPSQQPMPFEEKKIINNEEVNMVSGGYPWIPQVNGVVPSMSTPPIFSQGIGNDGLAGPAVTETVTVSGVMLGNGQNTAMLSNGRIVSIDDSLAGSKVVEVNKNGIVLESGEILAYEVKVKTAADDSGQAPPFMNRQ